MKLAVRIVKGAVSILLLLLILSGAIAAYRNYHVAQLRVYENKMSLLEGEEVNRLADIGGQEFVGTEVISLVRQYADVYKVWLAGANGSQTALNKEDTSAINTAGIYKCSLMTMNYQQNEFEETKDATAVKGIQFVLVKIPTVSTNPNYSSLLNVLGQQTSADGLTQEQIDSLANYIKVLQEENVKLEQNNTFKAEDGTLQSMSNTDFEFVPTDLLLWKDDGQAFYLSLNGTTNAVGGVINTNFDNVSVTVETDTDGKILKCRISNNSNEVINYKAIRVTIAE